MENSSTDVSSAAATPAPAESSPATTAVAPKDEAGYAEWRLKGTVQGEKQPKPKHEDSATSKETSAEGEEPEEKTAPDSEPGEKKQEQRKRSDAADRLQEVLGKIKRVGMTPSDLDNFEAFLARRQQQAKPSETTVQPPQPKPEPPKELKAPVLDDYKSWEEFRKAELEYHQQSTRQIVQQAMQELLAQQQAQQAQTAANQRLEEAEKRYGAEAKSTIASSAQALFSNERIPNAIKGIINDSPVIADLLYVMGSNAGDFEEFLNLAQSNPGEALRKTVLLEHMVKEELKKQSTSNGHEAGRDESGRFVKNAPAPKAAPPPAREVSGKASPPPNEVDAAAASGNFTAYRAAANRRDLALFKGR